MEREREKKNKITDVYRYILFRENSQNVPFGVLLSENVQITGTSTNKNLLNI